METRMTPPPQADAPPTPDEMRVAEQIVQEWLDAKALSGATYRAMLVNAIAAALSTTAARYREALDLADKAVTEMMFQWAPVYDGHEDDRRLQHIAGNKAAIAYLQYRDPSRAAAILASGLQTTTEETK
jgi:hypothetical protein